MTEFPRFEYDLYNDKSAEIKRFMSDALKKILPGSVTIDEMIDVIMIFTEKSNNYTDSYIQGEVDELITVILEGQQGDPPEIQPVAQKGLRHRNTEDNTAGRGESRWQVGEERHRQCSQDGQPLDHFEDQNQRGGARGQGRLSGEGTARERRRKEEGPVEGAMRPLAGVQEARVPLRPPEPAGTLSSVPSSPSVFSATSASTSTPP